MRKMLCVAVAGLFAAAGFITSPVAVAAESWQMPDLIGMDLQGAQDMVQSATGGEVWFSSSTDLTGQGRAQFSDRNWQVCTSTPPPGATITASTDIDFGVVRVEVEDCP
jgi:poly(3-hydroxybutyrate) depolymerase